MILDLKHRQLIILTRSTIDEDKVDYKIKHNQLFGHIKYQL